MDELYGVAAPHPARRSQTTAVHDRAGAIAALRELAGRYPCRPLHAAERPDPGDVLIVRRPGQHDETLAHAMIVGADPRQLWHAGPAGVAYTTLAGHALTRGFRMLNKESW